MKPWVKRVAYIGFVFFLTGLIATGIQGAFNIITAPLCLVGLAMCSLLFVRRLSRNLRLYVNMALYSVFFVGSLIALFLIVQRHPATWDATAAKIHSISPLTRNFLGRLSQSVHVTAFVTETDQEAASSLLREYNRFSPEVTFEVLNPYREPTRAQRFGPSVQPGDVFVEAMTTATASSRRIVKATKLAEEELTNAIVQVLRTQDVTLYFLTNHGDLSLDSSAASALIAGRRVTMDELVALKQQLERNFIRVVPLNLAQRGRVPVDASAIVSVSPRTDFSEPERQAVESYLRNGGRAIFLLNPELQKIGGDARMPLRNLTAMLEKFGLLLPPEMIIRETRQQRGGAAAGTFNIPVTFLRHPITMVESGNPLIFTQARPVTPGRNLDPSLRVETLMAAPKESWRVPVDEIARMQLRGQRLTLPTDPRDQGAHPLGAAVTLLAPGQPEESSTRIVVVGSGDFLASSVIDQTGWMLFLRSVNWLTNAGDQIAVPSSQLQNTSRVLSPGERQFLFLLLVIIVPSLIGFMGLGYSLARRELQ